MQLKIETEQVRHILEQETQAELTKNRLAWQDRQTTDVLHVKQLFMQGKHVALVKSL